MKSVMVSIRPKWCELIANGSKTIEVRKTRPTMDPPFKCYIYCTKTKNKSDVMYKSVLDRNRFRYYRQDGMVIGEFICSTILDISPYRGKTEGTCMTARELYEYSQGKQLYGWCISELVIYDKPKELREFIVPSDIGCCNKAICRNCIHFDRSNGFNVEDDCSAIFDTDEYELLLRPPQSWCYAEMGGQDNE